MTSRIACAALLACPLVLGCGGLYSIGTRNLCNEAKLIQDEHREHLHACSLANDAWRSVQANCPGRAYSADYARGFKAGFVDYLYAGGCGEPPALPPKCYRHFHAESAHGVQALQDWYAGFRHGAAVAKESGLRQFVVVSLPPLPGAPLPQPPGPAVATPNGATSPPLSSPYLHTPQPLPAEKAPDAKEEAPVEEKKETSQMLLPSVESAAPIEETQPPPERTKAGTASEGSTTDKPVPEEQE